MLKYLCDVGIILGETNGIFCCLEITLPLRDFDYGLTLSQQTRSSELKSCLLLSFSKS